MMFSLAELAFLLLFISIAAAGYLYGQWRQEAERAGALYGELRAAASERSVLAERLAEKENAAVPCWSCPGSTVPKISGTVTILGPETFAVRRSATGESITLQADRSTYSARLKTVLRRMFAAELAYSGRKNCYLRMHISNETNSFDLYQRAAEILQELQIVVVER
jgi:hypothetical protein